MYFGVELGDVRALRAAGNSEVGACKSTLPLVALQENGDSLKSRPQLHHICRIISRTPRCIQSSGNACNFMQGGAVQTTANELRAQLDATRTLAETLLKELSGYPHDRELNETAGQR